MSKGKRRQGQSDSIRWPNLFANQEEAQSLVQTPGFRTMLTDLEILREALEYDVIHTTPNMELTNFFRGQIAILERLRDLPEELAEWKKEHR
jgi:hypothetical protein